MSKKILYIDCGMGAAGDMLAAALLELHPDADEFIKRMNDFCLPGVSILKEKKVKCGITGTHISVMINGSEEDEVINGYHHHHHHDEKEHHHTKMHEIKHIVKELDIPENVKEDIFSVYGLIAEAESHVHGKPVEEVHFHEVGSMDAIADITAVCLLMNELDPDEVIVSPIHVGSGSVRCAHGVLPVPAPATAFILKDIPIYGGEIDGELCTPTGAALLRHFADKFDSMPVMIPKNIGYGAGKKDFERANVVRAIIDESGEKEDSVVELICNIDDMTAEEIGFAVNSILEAGAKDVYTIPIGMKK